MPDPTYELIQPNVQEARVNGDKVEVRWKCPVSGQEIAQSSATMTADTSAKARMSSTLKRSVVREFFYTLTSIVGRALGGSAGRVARDVAYTAAHQADQRADRSSRYTEASRRQAILTAFRAVEDRFAWDEGRKRFAAKV